MVYENSERFNSAASVLPGELNRVILSLPSDIKSTATEIRLRVNSPLTVCCGKKILFIIQGGGFCESREGKGVIILNQKQIVDTFQKICGYSVYSYQRELRNGYITLKGGHRAGICGTAVVNGNEISGIRDITSINIRISREMKDAACELYEKISDPLRGTLIVGMPSCGKTTLLRDLARRISIDGKNVTVIDERSELCGAWSGVLMNDMGLCDILNGYPKAHGIMQALRTMAPDVIICDEIGTEEDCTAIEEAVNAGVILIASVHAESLEGLASRMYGKRLLATGAFSNVVILEGKDKPGKIQGIYQPKENINAEGNRRTAYNSGGSCSRSRGRS